MEFLYQYSTTTLHALVAGITESVSSHLPKYYLYRMLPSFPFQKPKNFLKSFESFTYSLVLDVMIRLWVWGTHSTNFSTRMCLVASCCVLTSADALYVHGLNTEHSRGRHRLWLPLVRTLHTIQAITSDGPASIPDPNPYELRSNMEMQLCFCHPGTDIY